jgi:KEOPS complex subunit Pcc1
VSQLDTDASSPHDLLLEFEYSHPERASLIQRSVRQEIGEIEGDRTRATICQEDHVVEIHISADDLVALRAGLNTWCTLIEVAEKCSRVH